eukprot:6191319-Pleurochrysis_carterae.AAC.1
MRRAGHAASRLCEYDQACIARERHARSHEVSTCVRRRALTVCAVAYANTIGARRHSPVRVCDCDSACMRDCDSACMRARVP